MSQDADVARFNAARVLGRSCESLLGICQGLIADNALNEKEVQFLALWLRDHADIASVWPGSAVADRVEIILADGVVTKDELDDLKGILADLVGGVLEQTGAAGGLSTALPIDQSAEVLIGGRTFCFTGKFLFGTRKACAAAVTERGGTWADSITRGVDYVVIGTLVSHDWAYSSHGRKIEGAVDLQANGSSLRIIGEEQWVRALAL